MPFVILKSSLSVRLFFHIMEKKTTNKEIVSSGMSGSDSGYKHQPAALCKKRTWSDDESSSDGSDASDAAFDKEVDEIYVTFEAGLEEIKPHFVKGNELVATALRMLREVLEGMVDNYERLFPNACISKKLGREWMERCERHLLSSPCPGPDQLNRKLLIKARANSIAQIYRSVSYQVDKYNKKISGHAVKKNKNAKQSSPLVVSPGVIVSSLLPSPPAFEMQLSEEGKGEEGVDYDEEDEDVIVMDTIQEVQEGKWSSETGKWFSEDEYAEDTSKGKISSPMHDSSIR